MCEWEFKKRAEIVLKTHKKWPENTRKGTFGVFQQQKRAEISFKAELSHPCILVKGAARPPEVQFDGVNKHANTKGSGAL